MLFVSYKVPLDQRAILELDSGAQGTIPEPLTSAGCPGQSPNADVVHLGSPQGALCAMTVAGASVGSASVT